ncbi:hypothetical protein GCM10009821_06930 [Aeromicrobium halocynthiae]|uniref:Glycosyltransferase family 2 protein n=1 Tax=Aeromicrobium halocynthiae TaxID=560557 RepID=A0ABN2VTB4_9ACTN
MEDVEEQVRPWRSSPPSVGAVLVTHDGARWLPKVLDSFAALTYGPTAWRVVDVASTDEGAAMVRAAFGAERITYAPSGTGFSAAARVGVDALPPTDWIWLLHDDAVLEPGSLAALLDEATSAPDVAVVGPKIREWPSLRRLVEVGLSITSTGARETGLEPGEPDAGQHDAPRDVLAVNTAGMLVRRDVWDEIGGLDEGLPLFGDDLDLGWRVALAGYRTRTAPAAVAFHAEASRRGVRPHRAGDPPAWERRRAALRTLLVNVPGRRVPWTWTRLLVGSLLRFLGFLVARDAESAGDELLAVRSVLLRPGEVRRVRRERAAVRRVPHREIAHLFPPFWLPYRHGWDAFRDLVAGLVRPETVESVGRRSTSGSGDPDDTDELVELPPLWQRRPWLLTVLALTAGSVLAARDLWTGAQGAVLLGGALPPAPTDAGQWWGLVLTGAHDVGLGSTTFGPTFALLLAVVATPVWGSPGVVVSVLVLLGVPLAGLAAHRLGRMLTPRRGLRIVWAGTYALSVAAIGPVAQGRIGTIVALVVLPIVVNTALQLIEQASWQVGLRLGIWIAVGAAFAPVLLAMSTVALVGLVLLERRLLRPVAVALVAAVLLLGPWAVQRALRPRLLWWEAGLPVPGQGTGVHEAISLLLGRAGGPGQAPLWLGAVIVLLAVLALVPRPTRTVVTVCWSAALLGLAFAVLGSFVAFTVPGGGESISAWVGVPVGVWVLGLLTAILMAAPEAAGRARPVVAALAAAALLVPLGTATWWLARGVDDPLARERPTVVPAFLTESPGDTLVVRGTLADGVDVTVVRGAGPTLGSEALFPAQGRREEVVEAAQAIVSSGASADVRRLGDLGIRSVYAPDVDPDVEQRIDAAPLLEQSGSDRPGSRVWTVAVDDPAVDGAGAPWRAVVGTAHALLWAGAVVATAPVRRRQGDRVAQERP